MEIVLFEKNLIQICFLILFANTLLHWVTIIFLSHHQFPIFNEIGMWLTNSCLTVLLLERWYYSGHLPFSNLYESFLFLSWTLSVAHLFLQYKVQKPWLGAITAPSIMLIQSFASFSLPTEMQKSTALVPALQSNWLMMHVSMMILSYGALLVGSLLAVTFLVVTYNQGLKFKPNHFFLLFKKQIQSLHDNLSFNNKNQYESQLPFGAIAIVSAEMQLQWLFWQARKTRLLQQMDNWSYRAIGIGFPLLTVGILSGAVWANEAWGSYWSWDPKETWALVTWVIFAMYLHTRMTQGWTGKRPAFVALLGLWVVWVCYLGVNLLGQGLHSYGWFN
jgi:cytochrome c-type biogenesis protein CcsB